VLVTTDNSSRARFDRQLRESARIATGVTFVTGLLVVAATLFLAYVSSVDITEKNTDFTLYLARVLLAAALIVVPGALLLAFSSVWLRHNLRIDGARSTAIAFAVFGVTLVGVGLAILKQYSDTSLRWVPPRTLEGSSDVLASAVWLPIIGVAVIVIAVAATLILSYVFLVRTARELRIEPEPAPRARFIPFAGVAALAIAALAFGYPALFPAPLSATAEEGHAFDDVAFLPYDTATDGQNPLPGNARLEFAPRFNPKFGWVQDVPYPEAYTAGTWHSEDGCTVDYSIAAPGTYIPGDDKTASENALAALVGTSESPITPYRDDFRFAASRAALEDADTSWWNAAVYLTETRFVAVRSLSETQTTVTIDASCENPTTFLESDMWNNMVLVGAN